MGQGAELDRRGVGFLLGEREHLGVARRLGGELPRFGQSRLGCAVGPVSVDGGLELGRGAREALGLCGIGGDVWVGELGLRRKNSFEKERRRRG